jgi:hypothetical protein
MWLYIIGVGPYEHAMTVFSNSAIWKFLKFLRSTSLARRSCRIADLTYILAITSSTAWNCALVSRIFSHRKQLRNSSNSGEPDFRKVTFHLRSGLSFFLTFLSYLFFNFCFYLFFIFFSFFSFLISLFLCLFLFSYAIFIFFPRFYIFSVGRVHKYNRFLVVRDQSAVFPKTVRE